MKKMRSLVVLTAGIVVLGGFGCRRDGSKATKAKIIFSPGVMIVDEVCSVTQGYRTEGQKVTVRGCLNAPKSGSYALFNSQWDPFDPEAGKEIPRITIRFRASEKPDEHLGWYADVTGVISTEQQKYGRILVTLDDAVIEAVPVGEGVEMTPRKEAAQHVGPSDGDKPPN